MAFGFPSVQQACCHDCAEATATALRMFLAKEAGYIQDDRFPGYMQVPSGHWLFTRSWFPEGKPPVACCFIVPGAGAHGGHYEMPAKAMRESGIAVFAIDPLACGQSDGEPGNIVGSGGSVEVVLEHLTFWFEATLARHPELAPLPNFCLGHSFGGVQLILAAMRSRSTWAQGGVILVCPAIAFAARMATLAPAWREQVAADPRARAWEKPRPGAAAELMAKRCYEEPAMYNGKAFVSTLLLYVDACEACEKESFDFDLPLLCVAGENDTIALPAHAEAFVERASGKDKAYKLWPDAGHCVMEEDRNGRPSVEFCLKWMLERTK